ncbi:MAG: hypothetical protein MPL62_10980 [Alphaproteobacteria bacterium]|nr:hypothetical protein [Alphaproteobacteria bacterium]
MPKRPKLRNVEKYRPPYPLNEFPKRFPLKLGKEIVYFLATRNSDRLEGSDWEEIFARTVGAKWKPSNVGLDDVVLEQTAWGAKTIKNRNPFNVKRARLISGRNSPVFSYGDKEVADRPPAELGEKVLEIYNERVVSIRKKYKHLRTVVLIKGPGLLECSVIELPTETYDLSAYEWTWNKSSNLEGREKKTGFHKFTWQPHGSQFTIIENLAAKRLSIRVKKPAALSKKTVLEELQFDESWIEVVKND